VAFVQRDDFLRFVTKHPEAYEGVVKQLCTLYRGACEQLRTVGLSASAPEKLARLLLDWLSLPRTRFSLTQLNLNHRHDSLLRPCSRPFSCSSLRFGKDFEPAQRCRLRFLPCGISSWFSEDPVAVIASVWGAPIACCGFASRVVGAAGDPHW
jgi:hypothetical protein